MNVIEKNRRFYELYVADLIHRQFPEYEDRIAVGIAGEGSDCFGYDDEISRDHDFGTGVCLWVTDEDMDRFGHDLDIAYNNLVDSAERSYDTQNCTMTESEWYHLDHSCLKTATNGVVFRDDLGAFTAFRQLLLDYYPDRVWRTRIAEQLHEYAASLQVNYARCMSRKDLVAAELCRSQGIRSAMELFFLLRREYPPYYKWTYRALTELDSDGVISDRIQKLAQTPISPDAWIGITYHPNRVNFKDRIVALAEEIASLLEGMLQEKHLIKEKTRYLETHVNEVLYSAPFS